MIRRAPLSQVQPESGFAFTARTHHPHLSAHERPSSARVLEDGVPLPGPGNALHDDIRQVGCGRTSFWYDFVYFSSSDNSDPRTNGRRYEIEYEASGAKAALLRVKDAWGAHRSARTVPSRGYDADLQLRMWKRIGFSPLPDTQLLDFGCGAGQRVVEFRRKGFAAFGCDVALPRLPLEPMRGFIDQGIVRPINATPYRIPFDDESFDMVFSITVFEHVMDYDSALAEIRRVLKPNGISVHLFPAPWKPIETHAFVPFASRIRWYWWLYLWALVGIRNEFQRGYSASRTARENLRFLENEANYLTKTQIRDHVRRHFDACEFVEEAAFPGRRYEFFRRYPPLLPAYRVWFSETHGRVLVCRGKKRHKDMRVDRRVA
jgi:SAM-dependent methyltransferase